MLLIVSLVVIADLSLSQTISGALVGDTSTAQPQSLIRTIASEEFSASVSARCDGGVMTVNVVTAQPFHGVVHTRSHRKPQCLAYGTGSLNTTLRVSLLAREEDELFCGVNKSNSERSVSLVVRSHKSLELSDDKFYLMSCEQLGHKNVRVGTMSASLKLTDLSGQRTGRTVHGNPYLLRAQLNPPDSITQLRVKNCISFGEARDRVQLVDEFGCSTASQLMSQMIYNDSEWHSTEAIIYEMFKFADSNKLVIQCDAILCRGGCPQPVCDVSKGRGLSYDGYPVMSASTTVYVLEPSNAEPNVHLATLLECNEWRFPWLIIVCICLSVLLLVMLAINVFMCFSLSCRCVKTEVIENSSEADDYDPYNLGVQSRNGSRMSLNRPGQLSAMQELSFDSSRSVRSLRSPHPFYSRDFAPRHYSTLQSGGNHLRPLSRYSTHSTKSQTSQKSRKSQKSYKSSKLPKIIEIDYSHQYMPYTYSLR